jgi:hypothetical protein
MASQCKSCSSSRLLRLDAEMCLHFPGLSGINTVPVFSFGKIIVCLDCGSMESTISDRELELLRENVANMKRSSDQADRFGPVADPNPSPDNPWPMKHLP